jgi:hypothetical protein
VTLSTADKLFLVVGLIDFGGLIACIGFTLYLAYTKMKVLLGFFQNSSAVISLATLSSGGPWGKLMVVGGISGFVTFSNFYIKRGRVSADDIRSLPSSLRYRLIALQWSVIVLLLIMFCLAAMVEMEVF